MRPVELRPGLWRWAAVHPEWKPGAAPGSPADWPREVGSVAARVAGGFAFVDPLVPSEDTTGFWRFADGLVAGVEPVVVLTTIGFHRRDRDEFIRRYRASTSRARSRLPAGVEPISIRGAGETMFWLPEHRAVVSGDRLIGDGRGGIRLCPPSWLRYLQSGMTLPDLRRALQPLLDLPIEVVVVSHGEPVLHGGHAALARALGSADA